MTGGQILYDADDKVVGIATNDMGIAKDGSKRENFQRGVELKGKHVILIQYFLPLASLVRQQFCTSDCTLCIVKKLILMMKAISSALTNYELLVLNFIK